MYKNILTVQMREFNIHYKEINKKTPYLNIAEKKKQALNRMIENRGLTFDEFYKRLLFLNEDTKKFQYILECLATYEEVYNIINRFYVKDESLFDFFKETEVREKDAARLLSNIKNIINNDFVYYGLIGKKRSYTIVICEYAQKHYISVFTNEMNYTFCVELVNKKKSDFMWVYNLAMNFLFYINAFPECVIDGVPNGEKKAQKAKVISTSEKIIPRTTTTADRGYIRPYFRGGYFRHLNSDYFVKAKGRVIYISPVMVKGKAKTVLTKEGLE